MCLCAARVGQLLDLTSIGNECGITHKTVKEWLNILEASFIIFFLRPHHKNYNKRLVKSRKLYFYDTGLLAHLLNIHSADQLSTHYLKGGIFETFVLSEIIKNSYAKGEKEWLYFWRDKQGHEIDCIIERGTTLIPIEIKSGKSIGGNFFDGLNYWNRLASNAPSNSYLVYGGSTSQKRTNARVLSWRDLPQLISSK